MSVNIRWHAYHGSNIDMAKVHDEANARANDYRDPCTTLIHDHDAAVPCKDQLHTLYDHKSKVVVADFKPTSHKPGEWMSEGEIMIVRGKD